MITLSKEQLNNAIKGISSVKFPALEFQGEGNNIKIVPFNDPAKQKTTNNDVVNIPLKDSFKTPNMILPTNLLKQTIALIPAPDGKINLGFNNDRDQLEISNDKTKAFSSLKNQSKTTSLYGLKVKYAPNLNDLNKIEDKLDSLDSIANTKNLTITDFLTMLSTKRSVSGGDYKKLKSIAKQNVENNTAKDYELSAIKDAGAEYESFNSDAVSYALQSINSHGLESSLSDKKDIVFNTEKAQLLAQLNKYIEDTKKEGVQNYENHGHYSSPVGEKYDLNNNGINYVKDLQNKAIVNLKAKINAMTNKELDVVLADKDKWLGIEEFRNLGFTRENVIKAIQSKEVKKLYHAPYNVNENETASTFIDHLTNAFEKDDLIQRMKKIYNIDEEKTKAEIYRKYKELKDDGFVFNAKNSGLDNSVLAHRIVKNAVENPNNSKNDLPLKTIGQVMENLQGGSSKRELFDREKNIYINQLEKTIKRLKIEGLDGYNYDKKADDFLENAFMEVFKKVANKIDRMPDNHARDELITPNSNLFLHALDKDMGTIKPQLIKILSKKPLASSKKEPAGNKDKIALAKSILLKIKAPKYLKAPSKKDNTSKIQWSKLTKDDVLKYAIKQAKTKLGLKYKFLGSTTMISDTDLTKALNLANKGNSTAKTKLAKLLKIKPILEAKYKKKYGSDFTVSI